MPETPPKNDPGKNVELREPATTETHGGGDRFRDTTDGALALATSLKDRKVYGQLSAVTVPGATPAENRTAALWAPVGENGYDLTKARMTASDRKGSAALQGPTPETSAVPIPADEPYALTSANGNGTLGVHVSTKGPGSVEYTDNTATGLEITYAADTRPDTVREGVTTEEGGSTGSFSSLEVAAEKADKPPEDSAGDMVGAVALAASTLDAQRVVDRSRQNRIPEESSASTGEVVDPSRAVEKIMTQTSVHTGVLAGAGTWTNSPDLYATGVALTNSQTDLGQIRERLKPEPNSRLDRALTDAQDSAREIAALAYTVAVRNEQRGYQSGAEAHAARGEVTRSLQEHQSQLAALRHAINNPQ